MHTQQLFISAALLALSSISYADTSALTTLNGISHEFILKTDNDVARIFTDTNLLNSVFNKPVDRIGQVIQLSGDNNFSVIRADYNLYVIAQPNSDGSIAYTSIKKEGQVQDELYNYLLGNPTPYAKAGVDATAIARINAILNTGIRDFNHNIVAVKDAKSDGTVTASQQAALVKALNATFAKPVSSSSLPASPLSQSLALSPQVSAKNYLKNSQLQGNPASYIAQMAYYDQTLDLGGVNANIFGEAVNNDPQPSRVAIKTRLSTYNVAGNSSQVYTVTPSYTHELGKAWALLFDMPLTYVDANNAQSSYNVAMGAGLRVPVVRYDKVSWDVIPLMRLGAVNLDCIDSHALKCADSSFVISGGVQSHLGLILGGGYSLILQDQYSYQNVEAFNSKVQVLLGVATVPSNGTVHVYRNGVQVNKTSDYKLFGRSVLANLNFADTRFDSSYGAFIDSQQEYGMAITLRGASVGIRQDFKIGLNYTSSKNMRDAVSGSIGLTF